MTGDERAARLAAEWDAKRPGWAEKLGAEAAESGAPIGHTLMTLAGWGVAESDRDAMIEEVVRRLPESAIDR